MEPSRRWGDDRAILDDDEARARLLDAAAAPPSRTAPARLLWSRALAALEPSQLERALQVAEDARASLEQADGEGVKLRGEVDAWIAELRRRDPPR